MTEEQERYWETLNFLVDALPKGPMLGVSADGKRHDAFVFNCGFMVKLLHVLEHAFEQSGLTVDEWNALSEQERYDRVDAFVDKPLGA